MISYDAPVDAVARASPGTLPELHLRNLASRARSKSSDHCARRAHSERAVAESHPAPGTRSTQHLLSDLSCSKAEIPDSDGTPRPRFPCRQAVSELTGGPAVNRPLPRLAVQDGVI